MTGALDHKYVNLSEDHELNDHLKKHGKSQSEKNREILKAMGEKCKKKLGKDSSEYLTHEDFDNYIKENLHLLEDAKKQA